MSVWPEKTVLIVGAFSLFLFMFVTYYGIKLLHIYLTSAKNFASVECSKDKWQKVKPKVKALGLRPLFGRNRVMWWNFDIPPYRGAPRSVLVFRDREAYEVCRKWHLF